MSKRIRETKEVADLRRELTDPRHDPGAALAAIKEMHSKLPTLNIPTERPRGKIGRLPGTIVKSSKNGALMGFFRDGRSSVFPSKKMPLEKELTLAERSYLKQIADLRRLERELQSIKNPAKVRAGKASGASSARQLKKQAILADARPAHLVAKVLDVTQSHVRKVRSQKKNAGEP